MTDTSRIVRAVLIAALLVVLIPSSDDVAADPADTPGRWPTQGLWMETQMLVPGEDPDDLPGFLSFGSQITVDGDTAVVSTQLTQFKDLWIHCPGSGRPWHFPQYQDGCDWVYVFERDAHGHWTQTAKLIPENATTGDSFGWAIDVDDESGIIVVGNPGRKADTNTAYIFERQDDRSWAEAASIKKEYPDLENQSGDFGYSVAVSGHTVAVADTYNHNGSVNASTYIYERSEAGWDQSAVVNGGAGPEGIGLAEDTLVILTGWYDDYDCDQRKMVRLGAQIYHREGSEWIPTAFVDPQAETGSKTHTVPTRMALNEDGTRILMGAAIDARAYGVHTEHCVYMDPPGPLDPVRQSTRVGLWGGIGSAWIYELSDGEWVMTADIPNPVPHPNFPLFGVAVDIDGDRAVIGADSDPYNGGPRSGAAYIYEKMSGEWQLQSRLRNQDSSDYDWFGFAVGVSDQDVIIGAPSNGPAGSAHVFRIPEEASQIVGLAD